MFGSWSMLLLCDLVNALHKLLRKPEAGKDYALFTICHVRQRSAMQCLVSINAFGWGASTVNLPAASIRSGLFQDNLCDTEDRLINSKQYPANYLGHHAWVLSLESRTSHCANWHLAASWCRLGYCPQGIE